MTIILSAMYGIMYLDRVNISVAAKDIMKEFSLTNMQLGIAFSAFSWPYVVGQLVGGWLANRFGARLTLAICRLVGTGFDRSHRFCLGDSSASSSSDWPWVAAKVRRFRPTPGP